MAATVALVAAGAWLARTSSRWGATDVEVDRGMAGDGHLPVADLVTTHAVGVAASPDDVWPWIVQMGHGRAGWYSYDLIDNLARPSASRVRQDLQDLAVGDRIPVLPTDPDARRTGFDVVHLDPPTGVVLRTGGRGWAYVWDWEIVPAEQGSRLVVRTRVAVDVAVLGRIAALAFAPGHWVMQRRQLLGIRTRAEPQAATG